MDKYIYIYIYVYLYILWSCRVLPVTPSIADVVIIACDPQELIAAVEEASGVSSGLAASAKKWSGF